ncbi:MAG TPA: hypothetical protein VKU41_16015 [Polyangiaceae bacterium]|nr:hypothetical protein [Polyangiaceae bacterium]
MLRRVFAVGRSAGIAVAIGCASPTLPLPPPEVPAQEIADADHIKLVAGCGAAEANATIVVENQHAPADQAVGGAIASDCGSWDATVFAHSGDALTIIQLFGATSSLPTVVQVR